MSIDLTNPIFNDEASAWAHFEAIRWPHGPVCPHCGIINAADKITGKTARFGLYRCHECVKQFTATGCIVKPWAGPGRHPRSVDCPSGAAKRGTLRRTSCLSVGRSQ